MIRVTCQCGFRGQVPPNFAGKQVKCRKCAGMIAVPRSAPPAAPQPVDMLEEIEPASQPWGDNPWGDMYVEPPPPRLAEGGIGVASNPGKLRVHYLHYIRCYPRGVIVFLFLGLPFVGAAAFLALMLPFGGAATMRSSLIVLMVSLPFLVLCLGFLLFYIGGIADHCQFGCVCPAVVLSVKPYRIAVYTDLTMGGASRHAIKVLRQPLGG
ncbi:hypothetical protein AYO44_10005 [Planctomycetaceae bacterium SCGC AG-212-F19]|nr:hypothetical protein AYO44_10005 [Planctomycetaceae bacterium SCGC AG-212-F19]